MPNSDTRSVILDYWYTTGQIDPLGRVWERAGENRLFVSLSWGDGADGNDYEQDNRTGLMAHHLEKIITYPFSIMLPLNRGQNHWTSIAIRLTQDEQGHVTVNLFFSDSLATGIPNEVREELNRIAGLFQQKFVALGVTITQKVYPYAWSQPDFSSCGPYAIKNAERCLDGRGNEPDPGRAVIRQEQLDRMDMRVDVAGIHACSTNNVIDNILVAWVMHCRSNHLPYTVSSHEDLDRVCGHYATVTGEHKNDVRQVFLDEYGDIRLVVEDHQFIDVPRAAPGVIQLPRYLPVGDRMSELLQRYELLQHANHPPPLGEQFSSSFIKEIQEGILRFDQPTWTVDRSLFPEAFTSVAMAQERNPSLFKSNSNPIPPSSPTSAYKTHVADRHPVIGSNNGNSSGFTQNSELNSASAASDSSSVAIKTPLDKTKIHPNRLSQGMAPFDVSSQSTISSSPQSADQALPQTGFVLIIPGEHGEPHECRFSSTLNSNEPDLYRGDARAPSQIFNEGFKAPGKNPSLLSHINAIASDAGASDSAFVSTTTSQKVAKEFPKYPTTSKGFLYEINHQPNAINLEKILPTMLHSLTEEDTEFYLTEKERAVPHQIKPKNIKGAWEVEYYNCAEGEVPRWDQMLSVRKINDSYIPNPNYVPYGERPTVVLPDTKVWRTAKMAGHGLTAVGAGLDGWSLYSIYQESSLTGDYSTTYREGSRIAGGWTGAIALSTPGVRAGVAIGAWAAGAWGAEAGGTLGAMGGPVGVGVGMVAGGILGGLVGGAIGYFGGGEAGMKIYDASRQPNPVSDPGKHTDWGFPSIFSPIEAAAPHNRTERLL